MLRSFFLLAAVALFGMLARAELPCGLVHKVDFLPAAEALQQLGKSLSFVSAAVEMRLPGSGNSLPECSGSFISDDGDILTASHCMDSCRFNGDGSSKNTGGTCELVINGVKQELEVIKGGACSHKVSVDVQAAKKKGQSLEGFPENCRAGAIEDYAILHPKNKSALKNFSCLPLAEGKTNLQDNVFAMGYPSSTQRSSVPNSRDAESGTLAISTGQIVSKPTCTQKWVAAKGVSKLFYGSGVQTTEVEIPPELLEQVQGKLQTTVDLSPGSSGSPLINSRGEIVGSASTIISSKLHNWTRECAGATSFQPAPRWKDTGLKTDCKSRKANQGQGV